MSGNFPTTLPGLKINVTRKPIYSTKIQRSASGRELRIAWYSTPLYEYTMEFEFLRQGNISGTAWAEMATLQAFYESQLGAWDSFNYTDPYDGTIRTCRFVDDSLEFARFSSNRWEIKKLAIRTVR